MLIKLQRLKAASELRATTHARVQASNVKTPLALALLVILAFLPEASGFFVFGIRFTPTTVAAVILLPSALIGIAGVATSGRYRFVASDLLMLLTLVWMIAAPATVDGLARALQTAGSEALRLVVPYALMRFVLRGKEEVHATTRLFCIVAAIAGLLGILDTVTGHYVLRSTLASITGYDFYNPEATTAADYNNLHRLGLLRAEGPLDHPIMFGITMCYALLLSRDLDHRCRIFCWFGCGIGLFLSLSSAPWQGMAAGLALATYASVARFPKRWLVLVVVGGLMLTTIFVISSDPIAWVIGHLTLDPMTGWYRMLTWHHAGELISQSPIVGIGLEENWQRPDWMAFSNSVDSLWLRLAMKYGIPGSLLIAFALIGSSSLAVRQTRANPSGIGEREARLASMLGIITFLTIYLGFTVYYFGSLWTTIGMLAGMRAYLGQLSAEGMGYVTAVSSVSQLPAESQNRIRGFARNSTSKFQFQITRRP
jgi:O-antigen ligase